MSRYKDTDPTEWQPSATEPAQSQPLNPPGRPELLLYVRARYLVRPGGPGPFLTLGDINRMVSHLLTFVPDSAAVVPFLNEEDGFGIEIES